MTAPWGERHRSWLSLGPASATGRGQAWGWQSLVPAATSTLRLGLGCWCPHGCWAGLGRARRGAVGRPAPPCHPRCWHRCPALYAVLGAARGGLATGQACPAHSAVPMAAGGPGWVSPHAGDQMWVLLLTISFLFLPISATPSFPPSLCSCPGRSTRGHPVSGAGDGGTCGGGDPHRPCALNHICPGCGTPSSWLIGVPRVGMCIGR